MKSIRPYFMAARLGLAVGASLLVALGSLPEVAAAKPRGTTQLGQIDPNVTREIASNPSAAVRVIITATSDGDTRDDVKSHGGRVLKKLNLGNSTVADVPASQIADLAKQAGIVRISYDAPVKLQALDPLNNCCDQLQTMYPRAVGAVDRWGQLTGTGVGVAVIDSGVNTAQADFMGGGWLPMTRIVQTLNGISNGISSGSNTAVDDNGHGTFVAGIIAGRGWGLPGVVAPGTYIGIAPNANIISVKVSDSTGMAHTSDVIAAIEWVARHRQEYNIRVLNLSLVSSVVDSYFNDMFDAAVELAWLQGMVVVVSAGNAGPYAGITSPANDPFVITVGATDDKGTASIADDAVAAFSSYGNTVDGIAKPDLVAPGRRIISTLASPLAPLALQFPTRVLGGGSYIQLSGTSASAPVVSGVVAQLLQARPNLKPGQVKWLLTHTSQAVSGPGTGAGYPQVGAAVDYAAIPSTTDRRLPNRYLLAAYAASISKSLASVSWSNVSWDNVSWDNVSWDNVSWDNVSWDNVSWNNVTWLPTD